MRNRPTRKTVRSIKIAVCLALAFAALPAAQASAGRLLVTGHDADFHCGSSSAQCHYVRVAADYVRGGAPDPSKPMLVLDNAGLAFPTALANAGFPSSAYVVMDPSSPAFASTPLTTSAYSAILIASDASCGGCDLNLTPSSSSQTPDSDAINRRSADIADFFNAGGGIFANAGASHGDGNPSTGPDTYYNFIPLPLGGQPVSPPFCLTDAGKALGLQDASGCPDPSRRNGTLDDINCCPTHNSFSEPPSGSALTVAERDLGADGVISADDKPETLIAEGTVSGGEITTVPPPVAGRSFNADVVSGKIFYKCGRHRRHRLTHDTHLRVGCLVDARNGKVQIIASAGAHTTKTKSGVFFDGQFKVKERRSNRTTTELGLAGKLAGCGQASAASRGVRDARRRHRRGRRLWGRGRGRFRTRGRHSTATVRGTTWLVYDRCDGATYTKVKKGKVIVRDFVRHKTIKLRTGQAYLARPRH
jgi:hypothetical protein